MESRRTKTARFCSNACRGQWVSTLRGSASPSWRGGPATLVCEYRGQTYHRRQSAAANSHFCSRKCCDKGKTQRAHIEVVCKQCGQPFQCPRDRAESRRFCPACYQLWLEEHAKVVLVCEQCGRVFQRQPNEAEGARFCSRSCLAKSRIGTRAANWRGGKSFEPYSPDFNEEFKQRIRERDGDCCAICRLPGRCVHHVDYNKDNTAMANCVTLCTTCHGVTNAHREYWQGALAQLVATREIQAPEMESLADVL